jgi:hypothetical protein
VSDYRDDRGALRQRVEELEEALERSERANSRLEADLEKARKPQPQPPPRPDEPKPAKIHETPSERLVLGLVSAGVILIGVFLVPKWLETKPPYKPPDTPPALPSLPLWPDIPSRPAPDPSAITRPSAGAPFTEAPSCRCEVGGAATTLAYRSLGTSVEAAFGSAQPIELRLGSETVPPDTLEPKTTEMLLACDSEHMMLAFGKRVTAWNRETGDAMWIATLPANVGSVRPGPLKLECVKLPVKNGFITLVHAGVSTRLSMKDGES